MVCCTYDDEQLRGGGDHRLNSMNEGLPYRQIMASVDRRLVPLAGVAPRTVTFLASSRWRGVRGAVGPDSPVPKVTPRLALQVALDEVIVAVMKGAGRDPQAGHLARVAEEVREAGRMYDERGWLDDPLSYHRTPPPLEAPLVAVESSLGIRYEHLSWESDYEPWPDEPGRDRWQALDANRTAHAYVLRHRGGPRPWVVCVHGFGTGRPLLDFSPFRVKRLFRDLGLNVLLPVLPGHGPRRGDRPGGHWMTTLEMLDAVFAMSQATWDIRRALSWIRAQGETAVGIYGISLGGCAAALQVAVVPGYEAVVAAVPVSDLPALFAYHSPSRFRREAMQLGVLGDPAAAVFRVVSPMAMRPQVARDRRFVVAGRGDRMSTAEQAHRLWLHWDRPAIAWYDGNHVGYSRSGTAEEFVVEAMAGSGLRVEPPAAPSMA